MKKVFLLNLLVTVLVAGLSFNANAQTAVQALGARFVVNTPFSLQGTKSFTYSSDPAFAGPWGKDISDTFYYHVPLVQGADLLAGSPYATGSVTGKWVLIYRGTYQFSQKAYNVQLGGAAGVIIVNNVPGSDPVGMGAGLNNTLVTIPVVMLGYNDGTALNATLAGGNTDTISLSPWGFGLGNDLSIVSGGNPTTPYGAMPLSQLASGQSQPYNFYTGGFAANIGNNDATNAAIGSDIYFTSGTTTTLLQHDTVQLGTIHQIDSIAGNYNSLVYHPAPTTNGLYTIKTYTFSDSTDQDTPDDTVSVQTYVTDSIFCMGRWDPVNSKPLSTAATKFATGNLTWGPLLYIKDGPHRIAQVQLGVNDGDTSKHDLSGLTGFFVYAMKWTDGSNGQPLDSVMQEGEDSIVGIGFHTFTINDSDDSKFTVPMNNFQGVPNTACGVEANSWYYIAASLGSLSMDVDGSTNYFGRALAAKVVANATNFWAPNTTSDPSNDFPNSPSATVSNIPFDASNNITSDTFGISIVRLFDQFTPAVAVYLSKDHETSVANVTASKPIFNLYPNPAVSADVHIKLDLATPSSAVYIEVVDGLGRVVYHDVRNNLMNEDIELPTSKLTPGTYYVSIKTDNAVTGKPFKVLSH